MKHFNLLLAALAVPFAVLSAYAQDGTDSAAAPKKADRPYVSDYASKPAAILLNDKANNRNVELTLKEVKPREFVFTNPEGGEVVVQKNSKAFSFQPKTSDNLTRGMRAAAAQDWDLALNYMRDFIYPLIPLTAMPEGVFNVSSYMETFVRALSGAERYKELEAFVLALPLGEISPSLAAEALEAADILAQQKQNAAAFAIIDRVKMSEESIPAAMKALGSLRKNGEYKECLVRYTKISNVPGNKDKDIAKLWMIFCDLAVGNRSSADIYLSTIDVKRGTAEFSLCQMVRGMVKEAGETPDYKGALDLYAEGIVFGNASDNWMPELLFRTGMAYKNTGELKASNEIFKQISVFYPGDIFSDKAKSEIVEIKEEAKPSDEEDSEDEYEDEDDGYYYGDDDE